MKRQILLFLSIIMSLGVSAQKLTKEEKAQLKAKEEKEKQCRDHLEITDDAFSGEKNYQMKFMNLNFGNKYLGVGKKLYINASKENGNVTLKVSYFFDGERNDVMEEIENHQFSLYDGENKVVLKLNGVSKASPISFVDQNAIVLTVSTRYEINYKLSEEDVSHFRTKLLKAVKIKFNGDEVVFDVDNEDKVKLFNTVFNCMFN